MALEKTSSVVQEGGLSSVAGLDAREPPTGYPQAGAGRHHFDGSTGGGPTAEPITALPRDRGVDKQGKVTTGWQGKAGEEAPGTAPWKSQIPTSPGHCEVRSTRHGDRRHKLKPS